MIIYDHSGWGGWGILLHVIGSSLFDLRSLIPALLSATASGVISNVPGVLDYFAPKVVQGTVVFNSIQFLVSLIVVNRVREAGIRYNATQTAYIQFYSSLVNLAMFVTSAIDNTTKDHNKELEMFRKRFLRWVRALHVLAVEEFEGYESPEFRIGTLLFTEEILLFKEKRKPTRMLHWIMKGLFKEKPRVAWENSADSSIFRTVSDVLYSFVDCRKMSSHIYPFPLAQSSLMACICFAIFSPFAFGTMLPGSNFIAPCVSFVSVWLTFGFNLAAEMLEWPFDGRASNLPMKYYSLRFINDINMIEFGSVAPMVSIDLVRLLPKETPENSVDYNIPHKRPVEKKENAKWWLERAQHDMKMFAGQRRELRYRLKALDVRQQRIQDEDILGESITTLRAKGVFKKIT